MKNWLVWASLVWLCPFAGILAACRTMPIRSSLLWQSLHVGSRRDRHLAAFSSFADDRSHPFRKALPCLMRRVLTTRRNLPAKGEVAGSHLQPNKEKHQCMNSTPLRKSRAGQVAR